MIDPSVFLHSMACVDESVSIGAGSKVWQFASVIRGTVLGAGCSVGAGACLDGPQFGDRCIVSPGVDIGPGFIVGDDVFLGPHVVLCNDYWPRTHKEGFDYGALRTGAITCVKIGNGASIGAGAKIMPGVTVGAGAMVAANAIVKRDVPDNHLWCSNGELRIIRDEHKIQRVRSCFTL